MSVSTKYADLVMTWLREEGYTHCFFVAGGNSMHLLDGARRTMTCIPFVHEVSAGIAAEYFNEAQSERKAFVLVTAGPGLTNCLTAMAGAFLESRDLLVLGGQVKTTDLATDGLRQRGIQEVDGVALAQPVAKEVLRIETTIEQSQFMSLVQSGRTGRKGPVFLEICLDVQGASYESRPSEQRARAAVDTQFNFNVAEARELLRSASRPILLLGGGVSRDAMSALLPLVERSGIPVMTTWNGADRIGSDHALYLGRPNTWGQRSSNLLIQQSDVIIAAGTRLGLQQTGFNWQEFGTLAKIVHIDIDPLELSKGHPNTDIQICADAVDVLKDLLRDNSSACKDWIEFCREVRKSLPNDEASNETPDGFVNPYSFVVALSDLCMSEDVVIPCSSGGAFTVMMQAFENKAGQVIITDKGLASMGYGLAGAIGAAIASNGRRTVLVEGDGGFAQNLQELATVSVNHLPIKIFIFSNEGYASIRMTQRNYFDGQYLGCDTTTGLGFPDWQLLAQAYGIDYAAITSLEDMSGPFLEKWGSDAPTLIEVRVHPEQTYFPKITSRVTANGGMESAPLHAMTPELSDIMKRSVLQYLSEEAAD